MQEAYRRRPTESSADRLVSLYEKRQGARATMLKARRQCAEIDRLIVETAAVALAERTVRKQGRAA